ncbi:MAG: hypothetical protein GOP50_13545 [Candidatus Heimdallarchaeota archaeon]|nr:hypothetical protein [Candidatus Heimdallarchaeota archaeon]
MFQDIEILIKQVKSEENLKAITDKLRIIASNKKNADISKLIDRALAKSRNLNNNIAIINLLELKIKQNFHLDANIEELSINLDEMIELATKIDYVEGLALAYTTKWGIEKSQGNMKISTESLAKAIDNVSKLDSKDYAYYICTYSFAIHEWLVNRDAGVEDRLEECCNYFYYRGFYHGLVMGLGILAIIYLQTQNKEKSMKLTRKILGRSDFLNQIPSEIRSNIHFFIGFSQELSFNLGKAEEHLLEAKRILKPIYKTSIYSSYYLTGLSYLTATYALQGKLELAQRQMKEVDELIEEGIATKNLDNFSKEQMNHIFNLTKFYIQSRLQNFQSRSLQKLVQTILANIHRYYGNAIFFSEFLLNADLTSEQLVEIRNLNNPSTKRVEHILNFLIEKATQTEEKQIVNSISILKRRPVEERMTFVEKAFADLLATQEYYRINRFTEIYPLLKKYENQLHRIEVLELRILMEAFIQVGAFKNGDPLGPALQYMAIKKCKQYGFSGLEKKLANYLMMQGTDIIKTMP